MADFAKSQLLKYGWTEGKGLGKQEDGIVEAIKPKLKFDNTGVGHKSDICNNWWESVFNKAAKNISVDKSSSGVSLKVVDEEAPIFSNKQDLKTVQKEHSSRYKTFLKTSTLENGRLVQEEVKELPKEVEIGVHNLTISDDELFKACGGRTAHKGARHGLSLSGKLARIAQQENEMLAAMHKQLSPLDGVGKEITSKIKSTEKKIRVKKKKPEVIESSEKKEEKIGKKEKRRKRKAAETESEEDIVDEDNKDISHLLNTSKEKVRLSKQQRKSSKRKINHLVDMLDKSCTLGESQVNKSEKDNTKRKKKKKKTSGSGSEDAGTEFHILKHEEELNKLCKEMTKIIKKSEKQKTKKEEDDEYLNVFKDITFKRYEEQDPNKFISQKPKKSKYREEKKKVDRLSEKLHSLCSLSEKKSKKKKKAKKSRHLATDQDVSKIDASKLNSRIEKKKRKRILKQEFSLVRRNKLNCNVDLSNYEYNFINGIIQIAPEYKKILD